MPVRTRAKRLVIARPGDLERLPGDEKRRKSDGEKCPIAINIVDPLAKLLASGIPAMH